MSLIYLTALACLFVHELDAIRQQEWRFFFAPLKIDDTRAYQLFTALHVPLFVLILANLESVAFQIGMNVFLIVHALLHVALRRHPHINFETPFSWLWIGGGAVLGAIHLVAIV